MKAYIVVLVFLLSDLVFGLRYFKFWRSQPSCSCGLKCALDLFENNIARAMRIDWKDGTCQALPEQWFMAGQIQEGGYTYYKVLMTETPFEPTMNTESVLPFYSIASGLLFVINVRVGTISLDSEHTNQFAINIQKRDGSSCFTLNTRLGDGTIQMNHQNNGTWGTLITKASPFLESNKVYEIQIIMRWSVFIFFLDDNKAPIHIYDRQFANPACETVEMRSLTSNAVYERLRFYYPV